MKINYNAQAVIATNKLQANEKALSESTGRLSSGYKINKAKDNPAGLAMARRMNAQIKSMGIADNSASDGINIIQTADGILAEIHDMLQRMNELAIKASTDVITEADRRHIQEEMTQLKNEISRVAATADFNGQSLLDGTFDLRGYATIGGATNSNYKVISYSDDIPTGGQIVANLNGITVVDSGNGTKTITGVGACEVVGTNPNFKLDQVSWNGDILTLSNADGMEMKFQIRESGSKTVDLELTGKGAMTVQVGANEGQTLEARFPAVTLATLGLTNTNFTHMVDRDGTVLDQAKAARRSIEDIKSAIEYVSKVRSRLGAYQNRLDHTGNNLKATSENLTGAYSQIMDADIAEEMTTYTTYQVLSQAGISILSQANERASLALQLLN